jgi:hypothetical protein
MDICVKKGFFKTLTTLDSHNNFENYQFTQFRFFFVLRICLQQFLVKNLIKGFLGEFLKPAKNVKIPVFVIFGHFQIAFSPIFLGV